MFESKWIKPFHERTSFTWQDLFIAQSGKLNQHALFYKNIGEGELI